MGAIDFGDERLVHALMRWWTDELPADGGVMADECTSALPDIQALDRALCAAGYRIERAATP